VFFQPLVDVSDRRLYGFEALVRWNHPTRGLIGPGSFLGVAEETGMMAKIGEYVLREATAQAAVWNHLNPNARKVKMSVNIAEQQLIDKNFPETVADVLAWSGLPAEQLVLEITEDVIVDHLDGLSILNRIRDLGVSLAIDDFGTGQSSLSYIKQFDMVSTLKIDQVFVREMGDGDSNRAIIEAIVAMAKALGLRVVAEGVENIEQVNQLRGFGVHIMQGYLFNAPIAANGIDPASWFVPDEVAPTSSSNLGLSPLDVSRGLAVAADGDMPVGVRPRPARRG
jgi:EAL domain-containing protein (putative c-di-GMP-specific phosphodiesterase class I)